MSQSYRRRKNSISTALVATMASSSGSKGVFTMGGMRSKRTVSGRVRMSPFSSKQSPIPPFVGQAAHSRMIAKAEHAQKVGAGNHHPAVHRSHTRQFAKKSLGLIDVFQDVERAYAGEIVVGIWQPFAVVELAAVAEFSGARDVRLGDIRAV